MVWKLADPRTIVLQNAICLIHLYKVQHPNSVHKFGNFVAVHFVKDT